MRIRTRLFFRAVLAGMALCVMAATVQADVYAMLASVPQRHFDLILVDVDHSPDERLGEQNAGFYTEAGLRLAKQHLAPGGVFGVWSYTESSPMRW